MRRSSFGGPPARGRDAAPPQGWACCLTARPLAAGRGPAGVPDVVPHSPQSLVPSSSSTTSLAPAGASAGWTWCLTPAKALIFRRQAPRLWRPRRRRRTGRGASLPANPCSFVVKHHVFGAQGAAGVPNVVLHSPQSLVLSSSSTTSLAPVGPTAALASKK